MDRLLYASRGLRTTALLLAVAIVAACPPATAVNELVPGLPPDSVPQYLHDEENLVRDTLGGVSMMRGIVLLRFRPQATQAERQQAVDAVGGRVVGGSSTGGGDGFYLVRVPQGPDLEQAATMAAIAHLKRLPQVVSASRSWVMVQ